MKKKTQEEGIELRRRESNSGGGNRTQEEGIELKTFEDAPEDDLEIDRYYYNNEVPLENFDNPQRMKNEIDKFISGQNLPQEASKSRRKMQKPEHR